MNQTRKSISVRLDPELIKKLRIDAERSNRTLSGFIETVLKREYELIK